MIDSTSCAALVLVWAVPDATIALEQASPSLPYGRSRRLEHPILRPAANASRGINHLGLSRSLPLRDGLGIVADGHHLIQRLGAFERLDRLHPPHRDVLALAEREQRLAVGREHAPHGLLAMAVEVRIDADAAGDRSRDRLRILHPVVVFLAHRLAPKSTLPHHDDPRIPRPEHDRTPA